MANKAVLIRRNSRWYFNKAYPEDLWPVTGKSPFRMSLKTDALEIAIRTRPETERLYWAKVDALRAEHKGTEPRQLTEIESMGIVARWFREEDAERTAELEESRSPLMDIDGALEELQELDNIARESIAEADYNRAQPLAERLVEEAGFTFDPRPKSSKRLMAALLRGRRELLLMERSRLLGDYSVEPKDPLLRSILAAPALTSGSQRTIKEMLDGYITDHEDKWSAAKACAPLHEDEKGMKRIHTPGGHQRLRCVSESGLYKLIMRSDKPEAKAFQDWVTSPAPALAFPSKIP